MRIAIITWTNRRAGGAESYIERVIRALDEDGHAASLFCEIDGPTIREPINRPSGAPAWCVSTMGQDRALRALREWRPDVIYSQGLNDPALESQTLEIAPAVLFAHNYRGACISGSKTFKFPVVRPCTRIFGWPCLVHFYPRRCGGLNPLTMWQDYRLESSRLRMLRSYRAIITASAHMRSEYLRYGLATDAVRVIPLPVDGDNAADTNEPAARDVGRAPHRLLFVGRMELLKGGAVLLDALPLVWRCLGRSLETTFVGDGRMRREWEQRAVRLHAQERQLEVHFTGWLQRPELERIYEESDLLVIPSLWPEPFGLVGPEAGLHSLPVAAFKVGGTSEWLVDGINGRFASGDPPSAAGLAEAIVKCLRDRKVHDELRLGALKVARHFSLANHMRQLTHLFESLADSASNQSIDTGAENKTRLVPYPLGE
jgi:glycosyltransferase involved in cell wall biosynthesis